MSREARGFWIHRPSMRWRLAWLLVLAALWTGIEMTSVGAADRGEESGAGVNQESRDNQIDYIEFKTTDMAATKAFYSAVFGWRFTDYGPDYASFEATSVSGGGFTKADSVGTGGPLIVIYVTDLPTIEAKVGEHGGAIVEAIFSFPGGKRFHFEDPSGNVLAAWSE